MHKTQILLSLNFGLDSLESHLWLSKLELPTLFSPTLCRKPECVREKGILAADLPSERSYTLYGSI